jgi:hypothetical protein
MAVHFCDRQNDVVSFPIECMTQCHDSNLFPVSRVKILNKGCTWCNAAGAEVFIVHGRVASEGWLRDHINNIPTSLDDRGLLEYNPLTGSSKAKIMGIQEYQCIKSEILDALTKIRKEWYKLNFEHKVHLYDHYPKDSYWDNLKNHKWTEEEVKSYPINITFPSKKKESNV